MCMKQVCIDLYYFEHFFLFFFFFVFVSAVSGCVSISEFTSLVGVSGGIASSAVGLKICAIISGTKRCKSNIIKKKKKNKIVFLAKSKLNTIEVLISKALIDSYVNHDEFVLVSNVLYTIQKQWKTIVVRKIL